MSRITLSISLGSYDLNQPLIDGHVTPQGVELVPLSYPSPERHWRMIRQHEFDVCELSLGSYLTLRSQGREDLVALPVFPRRRFRHAYVYVGAGRGITAPADLMGRTVGLRTWQTTAAVWVKGMLGDHYGVDLRSIRWLAQTEEAVPVTPPGFDLRVADEGQLVERMVETGEVDALIYPGIPDRLGTCSSGAPIVRLFEDFAAEEERYFAATRIFPIMHTVVVRSEILERWPWVAGVLVEAFGRSRDVAMRRLLNARQSSLTWASEVIERQIRVLGRDPWPLGLSANRHVLETLATYALDQGLIQAPPVLDELFHASADDVPDFG